VICVFYRQYVSGTQFRLIMQEVRSALPGSRREDSNLMG